jgi:hypothetical protein|tara:strand:- start:105 stop:332 length:228 start_codon:yes stop_codon:yes gene_type:complete
MTTNGNYIVTDDNYELEIYYEYYWDDGNYNNPPEADMEILEVKLNGMDITDFYWDWIDDSINTQVWEYAQENKNN